MRKQLRKNVRVTAPRGFGKVEIDPKEVREMFPRQLIENTVRRIDELLAEVKEKGKPDRLVEDSFVIGLLMGMEAIKVAKHDRVAYVVTMSLAAEEIMNRGGTQ